MKGGRRGRNFRVYGLGRLGYGASRSSSLEYDGIWDSVSPSHRDGAREPLSTTCKIEILTLEQYLQLKEEGFIFKGQSYLFWEYIRILTEIRKYNPNVKFLLENVVMDQKWKEIFDKTLGVEGVLINSNLVSAQNRKRFYWTNICTIEQPEDLNINLQDILEETLDWNKASIVGRRMTSEGVRKDGEKDLKLSKSEFLNTIDVLGVGIFFLFK